MNRLVLPLALAAAALHAQNPPDARQIVAEAQKRTYSRSQRYEGTLQVTDARGKVTTKRWFNERIGSYGDSKAVIRFLAPAEVKGVALLVVNYPDRASDQWMWIPANNRERRVAMQDRKTRFFGTDFSFEDLEERDVAQFDYKLLGDETVDGAECWKIETRPREGKSSQYTRSVVRIRKDHYVPALLENFVQETLVRRLSYRAIENVQGIWTARILEMMDMGRNSRTLLKLEKLEYDVPLKAENFTVQALRREP